LVNVLGRRDHSTSVIKSHKQNHTHWNQSQAIAITNT